MAIKSMISAKLSRQPDNSVRIENWLAKLAGNKRPDGLDNFRYHLTVWSNEQNYQCIMSGAGVKRHSVECQYEGQLNSSWEK